MPSRADVIREARRWIGTPYHHQGRQLGASCDCIGLVIGVARGLGLRCPHDRALPNYGPWPDQHVAELTAEQLMADAGKAAMESPQPGQVGLFWFRDRGHGQHFAVFAEHDGRLTLIHAYLHSRKVIEAGFSDFWRARLIRVFDFRETANA